MRVNTKMYNLQLILLRYKSILKGWTEPMNITRKKSYNPNERIIRQSDGFN